MTIKRRYSCIMQPLRKSISLRGLGRYDFFSVSIPTDKRPEPDSNRHSADENRLSFLLTIRAYPHIAGNQNKRKKTLRLLKKI